MLEVIKIAIDAYQIDTGVNPYTFDSKERKSLEYVAACLDEIILDNFEGRQILIRMIQSSKHADLLSRKELIDSIIETGSDYYQVESTNASQKPAANIDMYAARFTPFSKESSVLSIIEAFHRWRPKCDERPQYPIDIVLIYDYDFYDNVKYKHPRYGSVADDAYKLKKGKTQADSLMDVFVIN